MAPDKESAMTNRMQLSFFALSAAIVVMAALASVDIEASAASPRSCRAIAPGICFSASEQLMLQGSDDATPASITLAMAQDAV
jgi:hypothetical protein